MKLMINSKRNYLLFYAPKIKPIKEITKEDIRNSETNIAYKIYLIQEDLKNIYYKMIELFTELYAYRNYIPTIEAIKRYKKEIEKEVGESLNQLQQLKDVEVKKILQGLNAYELKVPSYLCNYVVRVNRYNATIYSLDKYLEFKNNKIIGKQEDRPFGKMIYKCDHLSRKLNIRKIFECLIDELNSSLETTPERIYTLNNEYLAENEDLLENESILDNKLEEYEVEHFLIQYFFHIDISIQDLTDLIIRIRKFLDSVISLKIDVGKYFANEKVNTKKIETDYESIFDTYLDIENYLKEQYITFNTKE